jgi:hypothetical protein
MLLGYGLEGNFAAAWFTWISSWVPGASGSTQPSCFNKLEADHRSFVQVVGGGFDASTRHDIQHRKPQNSQNRRAQGSGLLALGVSKAQSLKPKA